MAGRRERMLGLHRYEVRVNPLGMTSVWLGAIIYNVIDIALLGALIIANYMAVSLFDFKSMTIDIVVSSVMTLVGFVFLVPGTFFAYVASLSCITRILHTAFVMGRIIGIVILSMAALVTESDYEAYAKRFAEVFRKLSFVIPVALLRYIADYGIIFITLTLERIRASGGTAREKLSAKDIDMENHRATLPPSSPVDQSQLLQN